MSDDGVIQAFNAPRCKPEPQAKWIDEARGIPTSAGGFWLDRYQWPASPSSVRVAALAEGTEAPQVER